MPAGVAAIFAHSAAGMRPAGLLPTAATVAAFVRLPALSTPSGLQGYLRRLGLKLPEKAARRDISPAFVMEQVLGHVWAF